METRNQLKQRTQDKVQKNFQQRAQLHVYYPLFYQSICPYCSDKLKSAAKLSLTSLYYCMPASEDSHHSFKYHTTLSKDLNSFERRNEAYKMLTTPHIRPEHPFKVTKS